MESSILTPEVNVLERNSIMKDFLEDRKLMDGLSTVVDRVVTTGIKALPLPGEWGENILDIKQALEKGGLKGGIEEAVSVAVKEGAKFLKLPGNVIEDVMELKDALKKGGIKEGASKAVDLAIENAVRYNLIPGSLGKGLQGAKDAVWGHSFDSELDKMFQKQEVTLKRLTKSCDTWEKSYTEGSIEGMKGAVKNIESDLKKVLPLENVLKRAQEVRCNHRLLEASQAMNEAKSAADETGMRKARTEMDLCKKLGATIVEGERLIPQVCPVPAV